MNKYGRKSGEEKSNRDQHPKTTMAGNVGLRSKGGKTET